MESIDREEQDRLKAFLTFGNYEESNKGTTALSDEQQQSDPAMSYRPEPEPNEQQVEELPQVDWAKVGKVYSEETPLQNVFDREFSRLNQAIESKLVIQNEKLLA